MADQTLLKMMNEVRTEVFRHAAYIEDRNEFYTRIEPLLNEYEIDLMIHSEGEEELFHSRLFIEDEWSAGIIPDLNQLDFQVMLDTGGIWTVLVKGQTMGTEPFHTLNQALTLLLFIIGCGLMTLFCLIIGWTWYISRTVVIPLKQIYQATEEIREGNFDYPLPYGKKDEIGRFISGFNMMRHYLKQSIDKQQEYEQNRKALVASISHELRTPLASIKGYVEGLQDDIARDEETKRKYLKVIETKTNQLDHLIEDLFEFSKINVEQMSVKKEVVNSRKLFTRILYAVQLDLKEKQFTLVVKGQQIPSEYIAVDQARIEQVMSNLIYNSLKYGADQTEVSFDVDEEKDQLEVQVQDNGYGIAPGDLPHVFDRFYRGEHSKSGDNGGTGLGLAISKSIIQAHNGQIHVDSQVGKGSCFTFTLPLWEIEDNGKEIE